MIIRDDLADWRGELPFGLVRPAASTEERRSALLAFARRISGDERAVIRHEDGHPVHLVGHRLRLSSASRDGLAAFAAARGPVGIDVEAVGNLRDLPLGILHEAERAELARLPEGVRAAGFAVMWAAKEAYVKALGLGFARDPQSFRVTLEAGEPRILDGAATLGAIRVWRRWRGADMAVVAAALPESLL